jgi:outer membrane protein OmpA-like peptidoglycan-associated protein
VILKKSEQTLTLVAQTLTKNMWINKIRIEGHTDNRGKEAYNIDLSRRRAESVLRFLELKGIDSRRMDAKGFGPTQPVAPNKTRAGRAKNRRVDFVIVDPPQNK